MTPIHIVGHAGCGKTTLIVDLVKNMVNKNIRVGTMKHSAMSMNWTSRTKILTIVALQK